MFSLLCTYTGYIVFTYGIGLLAFPDFFMGSFIYRPGIWAKFKENSNPNILQHLMMGLGLTWLSWTFMGYYMMHNVQDKALQDLFAKTNVLMWAAWCGLDAYVRSFNIYSKVAKITNMCLTISLVLAWTYVAYF